MFYVSKIVTNIIPSNEINRQTALEKIDAYRPSHCTELYGCYSEENDPQQIVDYHYYDWSENTNQTHCSKLYGCYSEENDPQQEIINSISKCIRYNLSGNSKGIS